jgi:lysozyme
MILVADLNHANPINFNKLKATGLVSGIIHKVSQGLLFTDRMYTQRKFAALEAGFLWGGYDFATDDDVAMNVDRFLALAGRGAGRGDPQMLYCLDYENNPRHDMSMAMALEFLQRVDQAIGRPCVIYGGDRIKRFVPGLNDSQRDILAARPLWGCEYGPRWKNVDVNGHPLPWTDGPDLWQYTGDGVGPGPHTVDGLENGADLSKFLGEPAAFGSWWLGGGAAVVAGENPPTGTAPEA